MANQAATEHARRFLDRADPDGIAMAYLDETLQGARQSPDDRAVLREIGVWGNAQCALLNTDLRKAIFSDDVIDVLAAVRVVARRSGTLDGQGLRSTRRPGANEVKSLLDELEDGFVSELLIETRRRMSIDPTFAKSIADSRDAITRSIPRIHRLRGEAEEQIPDEVINDGGGNPVVVYNYNESGNAIGLGVALLAFGFYIYYAAKKTQPAKKPKT